METSVNNKCRAFTSLEQSKKLADILPLESADMFHFIHEVDTVGFGYKKDAAEFYSKTEFEYLPCWSLAALLNVLLDYHLSSPNPLSSMYCCRVNDIETYANNQVDACYEMILKLHELNLL